jgi:hypothetical protein
MFDAYDDDEYYGPDELTVAVPETSRPVRTGPRRPPHTTPARLPAFAPSATLSGSAKDDRTPGSSRSVSTLDPLEKEYGWGSNSGAIRALTEREGRKKDLVEDEKEEEGVAEMPNRSRSLKDHSQQEKTGAAGVARGGWVETLVRSVSQGNKRRTSRTTGNQVSPSRLGTSSLLFQMMPQLASQLLSIDYDLGPSTSHLSQIPLYAPPSVLDLPATAGLSSYAPRARISDVTKEDWVPPRPVPLSQTAQTRRGMSNTTSKASAGWTTAEKALRT